MPDHLGKDQRKTTDEKEDDDKPIQGRSHTEITGQI